MAILSVRTGSAEHEVMHIRSIAFVKAGTLGHYTHEGAAWFRARPLLATVFMFWSRAGTPVLTGCLVDADIN